MLKKLKNSAKKATLKARLVIRSGQKKVKKSLLAIKKVTLALLSKRNISLALIAYLGLSYNQQIISAASYLGSSALAVLSYVPAPSLPSLTTNHPQEFTVMITNLTESGGGSGSVVKTSKYESIILTNRHVCEGALKQGGLVKTVSGKKHLVTGYVTATEHDLCAVTVAADLKNTVKVSDKGPEMYDKTIITGHPNLLPNMITTGVFSDRIIISVMMGARKCTEADRQDPKNAAFCAFFGIVPIIQHFEAQVSTATIMPGSSGSAVLNGDGDLVGVAFAGSGRSLSYAFIVPYEAVLQFLNNEFQLANGVWTKSRPWNTPNQAQEEEEEFLKGSDAKNILQQKCTEGALDASLDKTIKETCKKLEKYVTP